MERNDSATSFQPTKIRGQHFLKDRAVIDAVLNAAHVGARDIILEIGPGHGALTVPLCHRASLVLAVEIDPQAIAGLKGYIAFSERVNNLEGQLFPKIEIRRANILDLFTEDPVWLPKRYVLVSNLPFEISSDTLKIFLTDPRIARPQRIVFILQYELAKRITAKPGEMSTLSVMVQAASKAEFLRKIPRGSFAPPPRVDAALVRLTPELHAGLTKKTLEPFIAFVKSGFAARRRMLVNTLTASGYDREQLAKALTRLRIPATIRPQELTVDQWISLFRTFHA